MFTQQLPFLSKTETISMPSARGSYGKLTGRFADKIQVDFKAL